MGPPLDLSIRLTQPQRYSPLGTIASIEIQCEMLGLDYAGDLLTNPLHQQERDDLRWYLEEYWKWPYLEFASCGNRVEALLHNVGERLYHAVLGSSEAQALVQAWQKQTAIQRQVSVVSEIPAVLSLPWELLHDSGGFLALRSNQPVSIVRRLPRQEQTALTTPFEPPLRILLVTARPEGTGFIDPRNVARELVDEVQAQVECGDLEIEFLRPPTFTALCMRLSQNERPIHVFHFDGHGVFDEERYGQGLLIFETEGGRPSPIKASDLAKVLRNLGIRLVILTACQSAVHASGDALSSVAAQLIRSGVDAVVAMSASFLVTSASRYVEALYRALVGGTPVPMAQEQARHALHNDPRRHLFHRRPDEEGHPIELYDWWVPHFYQQRPITWQPKEAGGASTKPPHALSPRRLSEQMPAAPRYGFSGRARELLQIERWLLHGKLVVLHGFGGVGKTALVREAADWLTRTNMYGGACFVSFEHGEDATWLLSALGNYLGVYDGQYNPSDPASALTHLKPALKERHILVIADNLESILPDGDAPLDAEIRTQLWDVLLEVAKMGAEVLLTSRDSTFGDERLLPSSQVAYLPLVGLDSEDAYALASRLLDDLSIDRARAPYGELRNLLKDLDHHPLAIQLVLPAVRERSLSQIQGGFVALVSTFVDDSATGRNQSLLVSLDYSLQRLSEEHRALLPRLALFEGGVSEDNLLAITEIPAAEWRRVRLALEQAALLTAEQVHKAIAVPFLRFHPVLVPFLRSQSSADDPAQRERYARHYYDLAISLYDKDSSDPKSVRALVRRELSNLRRALDLLLEMGDQEAATIMAESITTFLTNFGLQRERDALWKRVGEAGTPADLQGGETQTRGVLTRGEWLRETGLGDDELGKGNLRAASTRFTNLLARMEALPEGSPRGRGSYAYCSTLHRLARCLSDGRQPTAAESRLHEALDMIDALLEQHPDKHLFMRERATLLTDLGDVLRNQGQYSQARSTYEEALEIDKRHNNLRGQAVVLGQLGQLARMQRDYDQAQAHHLAALDVLHDLGEQAAEATIWHRLGMIAQEHKKWIEAERYYRESLAINDRLGNMKVAAMTCNQLGLVARYTERLAEAEGWYRRVLELDERVHPGGPKHAGHLDNLANLLLHEVRTRYTSRERLTEARAYAEQALAIMETLDASEKNWIWMTLGNLAEIADLEGRSAAARDYRRRERETYAAFAGNRYSIDQAFGRLIAFTVAAARGDIQARAKVEAVLPHLEEKAWSITAATQRIWAGERDWHALVEDLNRNSALLVLRVLETLQEQQEEGQIK